MSRLNFTKTDLLKIKTPTKGRSYYHDTNEKHLVLSVTSKGTKSFYLRKRILGKDERIFLGHFPDMSIEQARKLSIKYKADIVLGINPNFIRKVIKKEPVFKEMFEEFMERYSKKTKKTWQEDKREINKFLSHWFKRQISSITKFEIQILMEKIRDENGLYQANRLFERIRAMYNKYIEWGWSGLNPCIGIKKFKERSRDRFLQPNELPRFFKAVNEESNVTVRDYILVLLLTGARKGNVLSMRWQDINLYSQKWRIPDTKNGEPITIPLSSQVIEILQNRKTGGEYVFPSALSNKGYFQDPKKAWKRILQRAQIEDLRIHDLRRTLGSWQVATGANLSIIGKSLGHKTHEATAIYARLNLDHVRASVNKATEAMFATLNKK